MYGRSISTAAAGTARSSPSARIASRYGSASAKSTICRPPEAAKIVAARAVTRFASIEEVWRRSGANAASLRLLAEAVAFRPTMKLARREALWAIKALRDGPLPRFAVAAARQQMLLSEVSETAVPLKSKGREVVEDYSHVGLSLRQRPVAFLRAELTARKATPCLGLRDTKDGRHVSIAGLVLVRQRPGSAKGVMFITIEDEGWIANIIV